MTYGAETLTLTVASAKRLKITQSNKIYIKEQVSSLSTRSQNIDGLGSRYVAHMTNGRVTKRLL